MQPIVDLQMIPLQEILMKNFIKKSVDNLIALFILGCIMAAGIGTNNNKVYSSTKTETITNSGKKLPASISGWYAWASQGLSAQYVATHDVDSLAH